MNYNYPFNIDEVNFTMSEIRHANKIKNYQNKLAIMKTNYHIPDHETTLSKM
ncbi:MAG TPA: hypothetical protein VFY64_11380 [Nitrososphaeraceae archaeon]|nr:hypothetical protein [Nitrososphaeraceae archaeon]